MSHGAAERAGMSFLRASRSTCQSESAITCLPDGVVNGLATKAPGSLEALADVMITEIAAARNSFINSAVIVIVNAMYEFS